MGFFLVRKAVMSDMDFLLVELEKFSNFYQSKYSLFGNDKQYQTKLVSMLIEKHLFLIAEKNGEQVGFIAGTILPHAYNPEMICLNETFWWVKEEFRNSRAGLLLLNEFIKYGKENCEWTVMTLEDVSPVNHKTLLSRGFKPKETSFLLES